MNYDTLKLINLNTNSAALGFFSLLVIYKSKTDNNEFER